MVYGHSHETVTDVTVTGQPPKRSIRFNSQPSRSAKLRFLRREAVAVSKDDSTDLANGSRVPEVDLREANYDASRWGTRPVNTAGALLRFTWHNCKVSVP